MGKNSCHQIRYDTRIPNSHQKIMELIQLKQEQTLLKFLFLPFWKACSGTLVFLIIILCLSNAWIFACGFIIICGFSIYTVLRLRNQLKLISEVEKCIVS